MFGMNCDNCKRKNPVVRFLICWLHCYLLDKKLSDIDKELKKEGK